MSPPASFQLESRSDGTLAVSGVLTFDTAHAALRALRDKLAAGVFTALDLAGVERGDSAGLACVLAVLADVRAHGRALTVRHLPDGLRALAQVCEVEDLLTA
ncbi:STAS domain-containing protein [Dyella sp. KRB-257]|uniref:STAS domain-containing protein n=1 Tax=Dyella sp. KRB-257 TaxID=3400915 RepID=UPI003C0B1B5D